VGCAVERFHHHLPPHRWLRNSSGRPNRRATNLPPHRWLRNHQTHANSEANNL
ncbi:hypothetical protein, partial [uncultured Gammaproteobacteria bacterium]